MSLLFVDFVSSRARISDLFRFNLKFELAIILSFDEIGIGTRSSESEFVFDSGGIRGEFF